jgi:hypothetical protein
MDKILKSAAASDSVSRHNPQQRMNRVRKWARELAWMAFIVVAYTHSQPSTLLAQQGDLDSVSRRVMMHRYNAERKKWMHADVEKLVKMIGEFNSTVAGHDPATLSPVELDKQLNDIQKLARKVKEEMAEVPGIV